MPLTSMFQDAKMQFAARRTARRAHRQLCTELAAFQTPAERAELDMILSRHQANETAEIREILAAQDLERQRAWPATTGRRA